MRNESGQDISVYTTAHQVESQIRAAISLNDKEIETGSIYGRHLAAVAKAYKGTQHQRVFEEAVTAIINKDSRETSHFVSLAFVPSARHIVPALVEARMPLSRVLPAEKIGSFSDKYNSGYLIKAFCDNKDHMTRAVNPEKLQKWAATEVENAAQNARQYMKMMRHSGQKVPADVNFDYLTMEIATAHQLTAGTQYLRDTIERGAHAGISKYMDTFGKIGGDRDLEVVKKAAQNTRAYFLVDAINNAQSLNNMRADTSYDV